MPIVLPLSYVARCSGLGVMVKNIHVNVGDCFAVPTYYQCMLAPITTVFILMTDFLNHLQQTQVRTQEYFID